MQHRARTFVTTWAGEQRERAEKDTFWNELLAVFGVNRRQVARFEPVARRYSTGRHGFIDLLWPGRLLVEHKSAGADLDVAMEQAMDYLPAMDEADLPQLIIVCDFARFLVRDLDADTTTAFILEQLPDHLDAFGILTGHDRRLDAEPVEDVNLRATALLADFHDALWEAGYPDHSRRVLLTRVLFCLFADDAAVWTGGPDLFEDFIRLRTDPDGSDLGVQLAWLFQLLDTPLARRAKRLPAGTEGFTYINGGLFAETLPISDCTPQMRAALLSCCRFNWSRISPAIFGSMFQNVMREDERRTLGAHYTSEANILRTIGPLFLDDLRAELDACRNAADLRAYRDRLAELTFFDPACGCGNFLVIAYREIRALETDCLARLRELEQTATTGRVARGRNRVAGPGQQSVDVTLDSKVSVGQFYGIEIEEFPARIAETAMHLADHLANRELSNVIGLAYARFPIADTARISVANALRTDWADVLDPARCSYLMGNPPFVGMSWMTKAQQEDRTLVFSSLPIQGSRTGRLDYVACWYAKAIDYLADSTARAAFVSTNSLTQGEQARALGPLMLASGVRIDFAHRTFAWVSEAKGAAHVDVVIIGFSTRADPRPLRLFSYPTVRGEYVETAANNINPYLVDGPSVVPAKRRTPLRPGMPTASKGSQATDGGHLIVTAAERSSVMIDPIAAKYLRTYWQGRELLNGQPRWCLWLEGATATELRNSSELRQRLAGVRTVRVASPTASVREQANVPALFTQRRQPKQQYVAMPEVSSENRRYIPASLLPATDIAGNQLLCWDGADLRLFGLLQSVAFTQWVAAVGGRLESRYRLSPDLTYCTFPFPEDTPAGRKRVEAAAQAVLDARAAHPGASLADLYDPLAMPADLAAAHARLDREVDHQITGHRDLDDDTRLAALLDAYTVLTDEGRLGVDVATSTTAVVRRPRRRRTVATAARTATG
ncbi:N-6 DNA methylase [Kineococcus endophyticus]